MTVSSKVTRRAMEDALFASYLIRHEHKHFVGLVDDVMKDPLRARALITALAAALPLDIALGNPWEWTGEPPLKGRAA